MQEKKNISIKEIAELSNVSVATVSRVINNNGRFSEATRKKVQKVIDEYGYTTNMAAKSLRISKSKSVGLIVPSLENEWFASLVLEIEKYFFENEYSVFICNTSQDEQKEITYFRSLDSKLVDGIMCISGIEEIPTHVIYRDIPIVCIDRKPKDHSNVYYVESNHYSGGYKATEELIKKGCKRIVIVVRNNSLSNNKQRLEGYYQALKDYDIPIYQELIVLLDRDDNYAAAKAAMNNLIASGVSFDGVFATNDWRAYGVLVSLMENNIKVPSQVKIVGFDDIFISRACHPPLTTIRQNINGLATKASSLLLDLMNDNEIEEKHYILPVELVPRESTKLEV